MIDKVNTIKVISKNFNGEIKKNWNCQLIGESMDYWLLRGVFATDIEHKELGLISKGTVSYEFYFKDRWFNVFKFFEPQGKFRNFYCNLNTPPSYNGDDLEYIDLDLDIVVNANFDFQILDEDEFRLNSTKYSYPKEIIQRTLNAKSELIARVKNRRFPFDCLEEPQSL